VAGTATTVATSTGSNTGYTNASEKSQYAVDTLNSTTIAAPGRIRNLGISIVFDPNGPGTADAATTGATNVAPATTVSAAAADAIKTKIQSLVSPYVDTTRGDVLSVEAMAFDSSAATFASTQLATSGVSSSPNALVGLLKMVFTALIVLLALFFAWRSIRKAGKGDLSTTIDLRDLEVVREELRSMSPGALTGGSAGLAERALAAGGDANGENPWNPAQLEPIPISRAASMASQMEEEISLLVEAQPDEVALLLRNWLAERRTVKRPR
jgi:flagellar M-ring protein FliF